MADFFPIGVVDGVRYDEWPRLRLAGVGREVVPAEWEVRGRSWEGEWKAREGRGRAKSYLPSGRSEGG